MMLYFFLKTVTLIIYNAHIAVCFNLQSIAIYQVKAIS